MKVLIVCSNTAGKIGAFIEEQANSLKKYDIEFDYLLINKKGIAGYLETYIQLLKVTRKKKYDIIHAHYGLSGMISVLQRKVPVVITYHGSDINEKGINYNSSKIAEKLCKYSIYVNKVIANKLNPKNPYSVIPCGVDLETNFYIDKNVAREKLKLDLSKKYILFSSDFAHTIKNYPLAKQVVDSLKDVELLELINYSREEVTLLLNASDCLILTSFTEGSPQIVKEALVCGCPVVSVDVGDVKDLINTVEGCYLTSYEPKNIADAIQKVFIRNSRINAMDIILKKELDLDCIAKKINDIYLNVCKRK